MENALFLALAGGVLLMVAAFYPITWILATVAFMICFIRTCKNLPITKISKN